MTHAGSPLRRSRTRPHAASFGANDIRLEYQTGAQWALIMLQQRQAFQCELDAIDAKVIELFGLVVPELARATNVLLNGDNGVAEVLA